MNAFETTNQAPESTQSANSDRRGDLLSRSQLASRWGVSKETIKRREREGLLTPIRFNQRLLRYRLEDIVTIERSLLA